MTYSTKESPTMVWTLAMSCALAAFIWLFIKAGLLGSPIYTADEYAYIAGGHHYPHIEQGYALDPALQQLNNYLYFYFVKKIIAISSSNFFIIVRLANIFFYMMTCTIMYAMTRATFGRTPASVVFLITAILPFSAYAMAVMPETPFMFLFAVAAGLIVIMSPDRPNAAAIGSGFIVALMLLIKPNAMANLAGATVTFLAIPLLTAHEKGARWRFPAPALLFLGAVYASLLLLSKPLSGHWQANPLYFVGTLYTGVVGGSPVSSRILGTIPYILGNALVILLLFSVPLYEGLRRLFSYFKQRSTLSLVERRAFILIVLALLTTAAAITMASFLTYSVGQRADSEAHRLHGRYYAYLFPFLASIGAALLWQRPEASPSSEGKNWLWARIPFILSLAALAVCTFGLDRWFHIFPWDFPELFAFYRVTNSPWPWPEAWAAARPLAIAALFAGALVGVWRPRLGLRLYPLGLIAVLLIGNVQTTRWQMQHTAADAPYTNEARIFGAMLTGNPGPGLAVGSERYGTMSYMMSYLPGTFPALVRGQGTTISPADVPPGTTWIVTCGDYVVNVPYRGVIHGKKMSLYQLSTTEFTVERGPVTD